MKTLFFLPIKNVIVLIALCCVSFCGYSQLRRVYIEHTNTGRMDFVYVYDLTLQTDWQKAAYAAAASEAAADYADGGYIEFAQVMAIAASSLKGAALCYTLGDCPKATTIFNEDPNPSRVSRCCIDTIHFAHPLPAGHWRLYSQESQERKKLAENNQNPTSRYANSSGGGGGSGSGNMTGRESFGDIVKQGVSQRINEGAERFGHELGHAFANQLFAVAEASQYERYRIRGDKQETQRTAKELKKKDDTDIKNINNDAKKIAQNAATPCDGSCDPKVIEEKIKRKKDQEEQQKKEQDLLNLIKKTQ